MTSERVSRSSRRFAAVGLLSLVCWQVAALAGSGRRLVVVLGVGFVLPVAFGKVYTLVPAHFDRNLALDRSPVLHWWLATGGTAAMAAGIVVKGNVLTAAGVVLWVAGVCVLLGTLGWTLRGNLTGRRTGTGEANADRQRIDRLANGFVPVAGGYLAAGSYELLALYTAAPTLVHSGRMGVAHLLATGFATLLLFAVGSRLLPRFAATTAPRWLVAIILAAGATGPALLVVGYPAGDLFVAGAAVEAVAVVGFALFCTRLFYTTDRRRVGFAAVAAGIASGVAGVAVGVGFATGLVAPAGSAVTAHLRLNVLGLLGLPVVGVLFQFYPPAVGTARWNDDRTALAGIAVLAGGLWLEVSGLLLGENAIVTAGRLLGVVGSVVVGMLVAGVFREQTRRRTKRESL